MPSLAESPPRAEQQTSLPFQPVVALQVERHRGGQTAPATDRIAEEVAVCLAYNGVAHSVMMTTPADLEEFALGFSLTEGIVGRADELRDIQVTPHPEGIVVSMSIPPERAERLSGRERNIVGRTGCGLCGVRELADAVRLPANVGTGVCVPGVALADALRGITTGQRLNAQTGAHHAAAWADASGKIGHVYEDVGRHNALDKLVGKLSNMKVDTGSGFAVITSRASYEMVLKAATAGITLLAAVSAPTALAVRLARTTGLTLAGFVRGDDYVIYAHPQRIQS
ncbi:MAG TPA: formate dehydrogenase accessory sulfurtransferase FdhD [Gammaproteobacteria bacterium]|nr:formate dehydrogenase accessory sulfurtransferase FdhD [Gammaproteobacteria bacterium]